MNVILGIALIWLILVGFVLTLLRAAALGDRAVERGRRERRSGGASGRRVALVVAALPLAGASAPDADARGCAGARTAPAGAGAGAMVCLINAERRARGLAALASNGKLARAARHHSADMVARGYFGHTSPGGEHVRRPPAARRVRERLRVVGRRDARLGRGRLGDARVARQRVDPQPPAPPDPAQPRPSARSASALSPARPTAPGAPSPTPRSSLADAAERARS